MVKLEKICSLKFIEKILQENTDIDLLIEKLVLKAYKEAPKIKSLEKLEGKSIKKGRIVILPQCPMINIINTIKERNFKKTGKKELPRFYKTITQKYIEKYPHEAAILHPFCIVHQTMREIIGASNNNLITQVACGSPEGKVAISKKGMKKANLSKEKIKAMIKEKACIYSKQQFNN